MFPTVPEFLGDELFQAAKSNNVAAVQDLVNSRLPDKRGEDPWDWVLSAASEGGALEVAVNSIANGARVDELTLRSIAFLSVAEPVYRYLIETGGVGVNDGPEHWGPMISVAASQGFHSRVQFLLEHGADPSGEGLAFARMSAIAIAARHSDDEMVEILLQHGAKVQGSGAVVVAASEGKLSMMLRLLEAGAHINEMTANTGRGWGAQVVVGTPLHKSVISGHLDVVAALLDAGADVHLPDGQGRTALELARGMESKAEMLKILEHATKR